MGKKLDLGEFINWVLRKHVEDRIGVDPKTMTPEQIVEKIDWARIKQRLVTEFKIPVEAASQFVEAVKIMVLEEVKGWKL